MTPVLEQSRQTSAEPDPRLRDLLKLHFHPQYGSRYWLQRQAALGWSVCDRVRSRSDLWLLGPTPLDDLRAFPVRDFIPQAFHREFPRFIVGETAGTSGWPCATAYRADEFQAAFVTPFLRVAEATGFPQGEQWLWVGPSGPHIIGKVVAALARQTGSMDPFSVDFDPRWAKRLPEGSLARQRYLDHVTAQSLDVLRREEVGVLFITPPALAALERKMSDRQREAIHGIHYGGMSMSPEMVNGFRAAFPHAVHLAGYGNTLFGVVMEVADEERQALDYFPLDGCKRGIAVAAPGSEDCTRGFTPAQGAPKPNLQAKRGQYNTAFTPPLDRRLELHVVRPEEEAWPPVPVEYGERGRVVFHRLDESCLLVGVAERDEAERVAPAPAARALGVTGDGLRNPRPPAALTGQLQLGLY
jgi:hypothetical protein